jgi:hypothetical protein
LIADHQALFETALPERPQAFQSCTDQEVLLLIACLQGNQGKAMSYTTRKREKLCLAVMMLSIAAFAAGAPPGCALLVAGVSLGALIVDKVVLRLRNHSRE